MNESKGYTSLIAFIIGVVVMYAKAHPEKAWVKVLADNIPQFTDVLNWVVPTLVLAIASLAKPFHLLRAPLDRLKRRMLNGAQGGPP